MGAGAKQAPGKKPFGDADPGAGKAGASRASSPPDARTSSSGSRPFGLRRAGNPPGRTEGAGRAERAAGSGRDAHPPAKR